MMERKEEDETTGMILTFASRAVMLRFWQNPQPQLATLLVRAVPVTVLQELYKQLTSRLCSIDARGSPQPNLKFQVETVRMG